MNYVMFWSNAQRHFDHWGNNYILFGNIVQSSSLVYPNINFFAIYTKTKKMKKEIDTHRVDKMCAHT
jgi:hypothetical protein